MNKKLRKPEFVSLLTNTACYCIFTTRKNYSVSRETGHLCYQWCFDRFNFVNVFLHHPLRKFRANEKYKQNVHLKSFKIHIS